MTEAAAQDEDEDQAERGKTALTDVGADDHPTDSHVRADTGDADGHAAHAAHADGGAAARPDIAASTRTVVKIGSSSLTMRDGTIDDARIAALVSAIATRIRAGHQVLLVTSGAIATGLVPLGLKKRPRDLATQQAAACGRPGPADGPIRRCVRRPRPRYRPGAADRRRPDAPRPLPERAADPRPPA